MKTERLTLTCDRCRKNVDISDARQADVDWGEGNAKRLTLCRGCLGRLTIFVGMITNVRHDLRVT